MRPSPTGGRVPDKPPLPFATFGSRSREFSQMAKILAREWHDARAQIPRLLEETPRAQWGTLTGHPAARTCGALDTLKFILDEKLSTDPACALEVAELAVGIAENLPGSYPAITLAQYRAAAIKDYGKTLAALARYDEAFEQFSRAEAYLDDFGFLAYDLAVIRLNVAITYLDVGRYADARALLTECKKVFDSYGDDNLRVLSAFFEGIMLQRLHRYREARAHDLVLLDSAAHISDDIRAAIHQTIGVSSRELKDFATAEHHLTIAAELHKKLGQTVNVAKDEYARGILFLRKGLSREATEHLHKVRHQFLKHNLVEEAGLCGLHMVEGYLELGEADRAERLARTIVNEFLAASLSNRAITALGYLSEAIASRKVSPRLATNVREYVLSLRRTPEREFQPQLFRDEE